MTRWLVQHQRTGYWLAVDHTEPTGRTWLDSPARALMASDPVAFASRLRRTLPAQLLGTCRLVLVVYDGSRFHFDRRDAQPVARQADG
jgi:hypothetical protein